MQTAIANMGSEHNREAGMLQSGGTQAHSTSVQAGFMPLPLEHVVLEGLSSIPVYLRTLSGHKRGAEHTFTQYSSASARFTEQQRVRLKETGVKFVYIQLHDQMRFRQQVEAHLEQAMSDPALAISARSELVYETSMELVNELLVEQGLAGTMPRLETIAKSVTTLVMNDVDAFSHLFAASQHDFYTATHMVNVGTWMVSLAYALGIRDMKELNLMCQAGMVHDIGKIFIPEQVLNKVGKLSDADWRQLRAHPTRGAEHLQTFDDMPELVLRVTEEHHERMDGSGYPAGLSGEKILLASRICAVVDSFDAMTAFRPFKSRTESAGAALRILQNEAPHKYDPAIVGAWVRLMQQVEKDGVLAQPLSLGESGPGRRKHERFIIRCPARVHPMELDGEAWVEQAAITATAHSLSKQGLGFLSQRSIKPGQYVRIHLLGSGSLANKSFEGQVVRCRNYTDGNNEVGMAFTSLDGEQRAAESDVKASST